MALKYARPEVLVETEWLAENLNSPGTKILEVDYDPANAYNLGHIPGARLVDWRKDINDPVRRDIVDKEGLEALLSRLSVEPDDTLVLYGDFRNWFAAFAYWVFKIYGHEDVRVLNGSRKKWLAEKRPTTEEVPKVTPTSYKVKQVDVSLRAFLPQVLNFLPRVGKEVAFVDVRSPPEFKGEITAPPEYPTEAAQRGGHIPGAVNIPWAQAVNEADDTFKTPDELRQLYGAKGVTPDKSIITYCRIGERSSHTWFVLKELLGYPTVINYDGSWSEYGNTVALPIAKGA
jgi:thiosulfate/3-mercaptopyruvate sulfurtransferase